MWVRARSPCNGRCSSFVFVVRVFDFADLRVGSVFIVWWGYCGLWGVRPPLVSPSCGFPCFCEGSALSNEFGEGGDAIFGA